jgi:hypothetical protein
VIGSYYLRMEGRVPTVGPVFADPTGARLEFGDFWVILSREETLGLIAALEAHLRWQEEPQEDVARAAFEGHGDEHV